MNKKTGLFVLLVFLSPFVSGDSLVLQDYKQRFSTADLWEKTEILLSALDDRTMDEEIGQFHEYALQFVLDNYAQTEEDEEADDIVDISLRGFIDNIVDISLKGIIDTGRSESLNLLRRLFFEYQDSQAGAEIMIAMGILGKGNRAVTEMINDYLIERNLLFSLGMDVDYTMVSACITAIMKLGDSSSYPALFTSICAGYPEVIASEAYGALELIHGNLYHFLTGIIEGGLSDEKLAAFRAGVNSERLTVSERGQLAELAFEHGLSADDDDADLALMRYAAVQELTRLRWTRAGANALRHFYRVQADFRQDAVPKERMIEAIACLGAVGGSEAALALGLQLGLINARMKSSGSFDAEITLALVHALGLIGDNAAFDHLLFTSSLPYPNNIKAAAQEALDRLKW